CAGECHAPFPHLRPRVAAISAGDRWIEGSNDDRHDRERHEHLDHGEAGVVTPHGAPRSMCTAPVSQATLMETDWCGSASRMVPPVDVPSLKKTRWASLASRRCSRAVVTDTPRDAGRVFGAPVPATR